MGKSTSGYRILRGSGQQQEKFTESLNRHAHRGKKFISAKKQQVSAEIMKYQKKKYKRLKGDENLPTTPQTITQPTTSHRTNHPDKVKATRFSKAQRQFNDKRERKRLKSEEINKKLTAQQEKKRKYQQSKKERFLKLCKKTHKGQPVMKHRIEHLLSKIQKMV